jgi:hypothetical protein
MAIPGTMHRHMNLEQCIPHAESTPLWQVPGSRVDYARLYF